MPDLIRHPAGLQKTGFRPGSGPGFARMTILIDGVIYGQVLFIFQTIFHNDHVLREQFKLQHFDIWDFFYALILLEALQELSDRFL